MSAYVLIGIAVAMVVLLLLGCIFVFPKRAAPDLPASELTAVKVEKDRLALQSDRTKLRNDVRSSLLQSLIQGVGGAALIGGLLFTWIQLQDNRTQLAAQQDLTRRGQIAERFTRAVDQLGNSASLDVRLGGIYGLEQIARDAHDDGIRLAVFEVLSAYIRRRAVLDPNSSEKAIVDLQARMPDVQAAATALGRRDFTMRDPPLDLTGADLRGANLADAHLQGAILRFVELDGADLADAHMEKANLLGAHLELATLRSAHLEGAWLAETHMRGAILDTSNLEKAQLGDADLQGAYLSHALLKGSSLRNAHLDRADLGYAHLEGASLVSTDLHLAVGLDEAYLKGALASQATVWPTGFDWRKAGVKIAPF